MNHLTPVLKQLEKHGQLLDSEIAKAVGLPLPQVHKYLDELSALGKISSCKVIQFKNGKPIEGFQCRVSGYIPPAAPGRKPAAGRS